MGKYVVTHELIRIVNPNGVKKRGIHEKEYLGIPNTKGDLRWCKKELILRCQQDSSNEYSSWY